MIMVPLVILNFGLIRTAFVSSYKNILIFSLIRTAFLKCFCFSLYEMIGSVYIPDNYKSLRKSIGVIKDPGDV